VLIFYNNVAAIVLAVFYFVHNIVILTSSLQSTLILHVVHYTKYNEA
jgi:hypothetical protein